MTIKTNTDLCVGLVNFVQNRIYPIQNESLIQYFYADFNRETGSRLNSAALMIAAEYLQGSVRDIAKDFGNIREQRIAQILKQVLESVRYLHDEPQIEA